MEKERELISHCKICGKDIYEDDDYLSNHNDEFLCEDCQMDGYTMCEDCGEFVDRFDNVGDRTVCYNCLENNYYQCENCSEWFERRDVYETYNGHYVCEGCADYHYSQCNDCGRYVHNEDRYYSERRDADYCPDCWDDRDEVIGSYHSHSVCEYFNDNNVVHSPREFEGGYGFELEVDDGDDPDGCADMLQSLLGNRAWFETDGSLSSDGFEIITAPHTRLAMERDFPLDEMCNELRSYGFKSHDAGCCGLHVHVSRSLFGNTEEERIENIAKMILFYEIFWDDLVKVSRRKEFSYCYKMSDSDGDYTDGTQIKEETAKKIAEDNSTRKWNRDRYYSINLRNENTIEFRLMRGTLNKDTLKATLDFTMTIVENCKNIPMEKVNDKTLWLQGLKTETINYLRKRRAFGYEEDTYDTEND